MYRLGTGIRSGGALVPALSWSTATANHSIPRSLAFNLKPHSTSSDKGSVLSNSVLEKPSSNVMPCSDDMEDRIKSLSAASSLSAIVSDYRNICNEVDAKVIVSGSYKMINNELSEDLGRLNHGSLLILEALVHTKKPWITKDSCCPDFTSCLQRLSKEVELDDARMLVWKVVESKGLHSSESNPPALLREAQSAVTMSKKILESTMELLLHCNARLAAAYESGDEDAIASAEKKANKAQHDNKAAEAKYEVKENALNKLIADVASKKEAILTTFREASLEPNPPAVLREAQSAVTMYKKILESTMELLLHCNARLGAAYESGDEDAIASAKKDVKEAQHDKNAADVEKKVKENDLNKLVADIASKKGAVREASLEPASLTRRLPFGMLGRDECVASIKEYTLNPNDKYPPIMIISTSRAGKSLMLDTLKERFNEDVDDGSVFVVTCSLNSCRKTADKFEGKQCTTSDAPQFVMFVYNLLLFGSIGQFKMPVNANWDSLAWVEPNELCSLIREKHNLKPTTKLLFAVDELTTIFDKFDKDGRTYIASQLGYLCSEDSQLLVTGFTVNAEKTFEGVSRRAPILVVLKAISEENRYQQIPLMTAMLWGIRGQMGVEPDNIQALTYFYCIAHEVLKSSPGLMGTIVERLVMNTDGKLKNITCRMPLWDVVGGLRDLLPDKGHFRNPENLSSGLDNLNGYLTSKDTLVKERCSEELMRLNMAAPGRLDVFRILMAFIEWKQSSNTTVYAVPAVDVLYEFVDHYNTLYLKWGEEPSGELKLPHTLNVDGPEEKKVKLGTTKVTDFKDDGAEPVPEKVKPFKDVKGEFFEVAIRYGLRLLWLQMQSGRGAWDTPLGMWADSEFLGDLKVKSFNFCFPINQKKNPVDLSKEVIEMFEPNTLLYPAGKVSGKPETNPLVDLVLNMPTKAGIVQVWVQAKHTLHIKPLSVSTLRNAMSVVNKYNGQVSANPDQQVVRVLYLLVGPDRLEAKLVHDGGSKEVISNKRHLLHGGEEGSGASLTIRCVTTPKDRESLLGEFISQLVPDFESHDSPLELSLERKVEKMSALNRIPLQNESSELGVSRSDLAASETLFFGRASGDSRFAAMKTYFPVDSEKAA